MSEDKICPFGEAMVKRAQELVSQLECEELPPDFDPDDMYYDQVIAHIRHTYTNYDDLLTELPSCTEFIEESESNRQLCLQAHDIEAMGEKCPWCEEAHTTLKQEAASLARGMWDERCKRA